MIGRLWEEFDRKIANRRLKSLLLHSLFWLVWLSRSFYDLVGAWGWKGSLLYIMVVFVSQVPLVYTHLYLLVPRFLNRKNYPVYFTLLILLLLGYSWTHFHLLLLLPDSWLPATMAEFINTRMDWNFDLLEGLIVVVLTYALKYTLLAVIIQNELLKVQKEKLSLELRSLKAQVHPHFLFNTLNNLYSLTLQNSSQASELVLKLSDIMRYVLYRANAEKVKLEDEISFIHNYTELQRIRYNDSFEIKFSVEGVCEKRMIAPLLFIDFVENAFKHGADRSIGGGYVHILFHCGEHELTFRVENSLGTSFETHEASQEKGIGLQNVKRRLDLLYPGAHRLEIGADEKCFRVILTIQPDHDL